MADEPDPYPQHLRLRRTVRAVTCGAFAVIASMVWASHLGSIPRLAAGAGLTMLSLFVVERLTPLRSWGIPVGVSTWPASTFAGRVRYRRTNWWATAPAIVLVGAMVGAAAFSSLAASNPALACLLVFGPPGLVALRVERMGVIFQGDELRLRGFLRTERFRAAEVVGFQMTRDDKVTKAQMIVVDPLRRPQDLPTLSFAHRGVMQAERMEWNNGWRTDDVVGRLRAQLAHARAAHD